MTVGRVPLRQLRRSLLRRHVEKGQHPAKPRVLFDLLEIDRGGRGFRLFPPPARGHPPLPSFPVAAAPENGSLRAPAIWGRSPAETDGGDPPSPHCCLSGSAAAPAHCVAPRRHRAPPGSSSSSASAGPPLPAASRSSSPRAYLDGRR